MSSEADQIRALKALLKQSEKRAAAAEAKANKAEAKANKAEEKANKAEAKAHEAVAKAIEAEAKAIAAEAKARDAELRAAAAQVAGDGRNLSIGCAAAIVQQCLDLLSSLPKDLPEADLAQIDEISRRFESVVQAAKGLERFMPYIKRLLNSSSERIGKQRKSAEKLKQEAAEAEQQEQTARSKIADRRRTIKKRESELRGKLDDISTTAKDAVAEKGDSASSVAKLAAGIAAIPVPEVAEKKALPNGKKTLGRQAVEVTDDRLVPLDPPSEFVCPHCGGVHGEELKSFEIKLRDLMHNLGELANFTMPQYRIMECCTCNHCHVMIPEEASVPVTPLGTVSQDLVLATASMVYQGVPEHRAQSLLHVDELQLGNSTLGDNMKRWMDQYGQPLLAKVEEQCKQAPVIVVDETPFTVLQQTGQSKIVLEDKPKQAYVLAVSSAPHAEFPFALYYQLDGRGGKHIRSRLGGFTPKALVTDGYGEYSSDAMAETLKFELNGAAHQSCMIHFRRVVLDVVSPFFNVGRLSANDAADIRRKLDEASPEYVLAAVLEALAKIYAHEQDLKPRPGEAYDAFLERVAKSRRANASVLMDYIDKLMETIKDKLVVCSDGKHYEAIDKNNLAAKAVRYYYNRRDELRLFLTNPLVPPDSNTAERCVRTIAVLEDVCKFKQSPEYLASLCRYFSLFATAELYGITSPEKWLQAYGKAMFNYRADRTAEHKRDEGTISKRLSYFTEDSAEGFDLEAWLPWNYAKARGFSK